MAARTSAVRPIAQSPWPKYHQIYLVLRQQILDGVYAAQASLPSEPQLAEAFGVSRITVRHALERLARERWISKQRGRGTFVERGLPTPPVQASLTGSVSDLIDMGRKTQAQVKSFQYVNAGPEVAAALRIAPAEVVQRAVRVRSYRGCAYAHITTWVPERLGRTYTRADLAKEPLLLLLERGGVRAVAARQKVTAKLAEPDVARWLATEPGAPLLCIRRVVCDADDQVIEYLVGLYRADTYEHEISFNRESSSDGRIWVT